MIKLLFMDGSIKNMSYPAANVEVICEGNGLGGSVCLLRIKKC